MIQYNNYKLTCTCNFCGNYIYFHSVINLTQNCKYKRVLIAFDAMFASHCQSISGNGT